MAPLPPPIIRSNSCPHAWTSHSHIYKSCIYLYSVSMRCDALHPKERETERQKQTDRQTRVWFLFEQCIRYRIKQTYFCMYYLCNSNVLVICVSNSVSLDRNSTSYGLALKCTCFPPPHFFSFSYSLSAPPLSHILAIHY